MMDDSLYEKLNGAFKSVCKVVLGGEIGELKDYENWLSENLKSPIEKRSIWSGKKVRMSNFGDKYRTSRFISYDELADFSKKSALSIDEIKDIDTIKDAISEKFAYCGNILLGRCSHIEQSSGVEDSHYVFGSTHIKRSKYVFKSQVLDNCSHIFGCYDADTSKYGLKATGFGGSGSGVNTIFDSFTVESSSRVYYSLLLSGCSDCFFCFFQNGARNCIGNLKLERDKYQKIKESLLEQIRTDLETKKSTLNLADLLKNKEPEEKEFPEFRDEFSIEPINRGFKSTVYSVFGKKDVPDIQEYGEYFGKRTDLMWIIKTKSALTGRDTYALKAYVHLDPEKVPVIGREWEVIRSRKLSESECESITLENAPMLLKKIAFLSFMFYERSKNSFPKILPLISSDVYFSSIVIASRVTAYSFWTLDSSHLFGSDFINNSTSLIGCKHSSSLKRCFECDNCRMSSDLIFCHNLESSSNSMFCFNLKGARNCIGNLSLNPSEFERMSNSLKEQIYEEFSKMNGESIYEILR